MTDEHTIPAEPVTFVDEILSQMIKHKEINEAFSINEAAKVSFGCSLGKWIQTDGKKMTEEQVKEAVKETKSFIIGYYWGRKHRMALSI